MENFDNEQWRDIAGYEGIYQVSNLGRVRSLKFGKVRVLRPQKDKDGYLLVSLCKGGKIKKCRVHRIVASAFITNNDDAKNEINHRNEIKSDNRVSNLEYCDRSYNLTYNDLNWKRKGCVRRKVEDLYDPNLTYAENLKIFRDNGVECSTKVIHSIRKDLKLERPQPVRDKIKDLYDQYLSIDENIKVFKEQGIECCGLTIIRLRKELGLIKH